MRRCRDLSEALALGRVYERSGDVTRADACYRRAAEADDVDVKGEALYRLGLRYRRERRFEEAAAIWQRLLTLGSGRARTSPATDALRQFAAEALAIHQEHRAKDYLAARELAMFALEEIVKPPAGATAETTGCATGWLGSTGRSPKSGRYRPLFWG